MKKKKDNGLYQPPEAEVMTLLKMSDIICASGTMELENIVEDDEAIIWND